MLFDLARWIQSTALSEVLAGSIWAYTLIAALHVLGMAWFGGAVLLATLRGNDWQARPHPAVLWAGAAMMVVTGLLLCLIEPHRSVTSQSFRLKMVLLMALGVLVPIRSKLKNKAAIALTLTLWAGVILASRGIAFF